MKYSPSPNTTRFLPTASICQGAWRSQRGSLFTSHTRPATEPCGIALLSGAGSGWRSGRAYILRRLTRLTESATSCWSSGRSRPCARYGKKPSWFTADGDGMRICPQSIWSRLPISTRPSRPGGSRQCPICFRLEMRTRSTIGSSRVEPRHSRDRILRLGSCTSRCRCSGARRLPHSSRNRFLQFARHVPSDGVNARALREEQASLPWAPAAPALDDFRARRLRVGTRPLEPGEAEALALPHIRPTSPRPRQEHERARHRARSVVSGRAKSGRFRISRHARGSSASVGLWSLGDPIVPVGVTGPVHGSGSGGPNLRGRARGRHAGGDRKVRDMGVRAVFGVAVHKCSRWREVLVAPGSICEQVPVTTRSA